MKSGHEFLYLCNADIEACGLTLAEVEAAVEKMFVAKSAGAAATTPKLVIPSAQGPLFMTSPAVLEDPGYAGVKWIGVADSAATGLPHIAGLILLNDAQTGMPAAVMDARWVTGVRTAAITAVAARRLARPDSAAIGFVACGLQARTHLAALRPHFPLVRLRAYSRRLETAEAFAAEARDQGLEAIAVGEPREAVEGMDIVVTTTPGAPTPFLDAAWLGPGSFAAMVDLGRPWITEGLADLDQVVADDLSPAASSRLNFPRAFDGTIEDLVTGRAPGRALPGARTAVIFAGIGLADVAVAAALYEKAVAQGLGRLLPL